MMTFFQVNSVVSCKSQPVMFITTHGGNQGVFVPHALVCMLVAMVVNLIAMERDVVIVV